MKAEGAGRGLAWAAAGLVLAGAALLTAALWTTRSEETLMVSPLVVRVRREGLLGTRCSLELGASGVSSPAPCDVVVELGTTGSQALFLASTTNRSCVRDATTLAELGCSEPRADLATLDDEWVTFVTREGDTFRVVRIARAGGRRVSFLLPPHSYVGTPRGPDVEMAFVTDDHRVLHLDGEGFVEVTPATPHGCALAAGHGAVWREGASGLGLALEGFPAHVDAPFLLEDDVDLSLAMQCGATLVVETMQPHAAEASLHVHGVTSAGVVWTSPVVMPLTTIEDCEPGRLRLSGATDTRIDLATGAVVP